MIASDKPQLSINRRRVLQMIAAGSAATFLESGSLMAKGLERKTQGYGPDVDMNNPVVTWDKALTEGQLQTVTVLCDIIIPADNKSPSASELEIADFIDEWISAPYPAQQADRDIILAGLKWLDQQAAKQQVRYFRHLSSKKQTTIFDRLASLVEQGQGDTPQEQFFDRLVYLVAGGFYTTPEGMTDMGYIGNVPLAEFEGPSDEVRKKLGV